MYICIYIYILYIWSETAIRAGLNFRGSHYFLREREKEREIENDVRL